MPVNRNAAEREIVVVVHADESCLGNQNAGASRGGAGALIEYRSHADIVRRDFYLSSPDTTNNRMALLGAIELLQCLEALHPTFRTMYWSDSQYLVKGMTEWIHGWERRGWKRKEGAVLNVELWQALLARSRRNPVDWRWVRGHFGHVKNEYADALAVGAARDQSHSNGPLASGFLEWLADQQAAGKFTDYDPDRDFEAVEQPPVKTT